MEKFIPCWYYGFVLAVDTEGIILQILPIVARATLYLDINPRGISPPFLF